jgi:hypothetical protein
MKLIISLALLLVTQSSFAAQVLRAKLDSAKKNILIDVRYSGGCKKHDFSLKVGGCAESMPVQCRVKLMHNSNGDFCEAIKFETVVISLKDAGAVGSYYKGAFLTIIGDIDSQTNQPSKATVQLP